MAQSPTFEAFRPRYQRAVDNGLIAAAYVYRNEVVSRLLRGYTTGDFVTPHVALTVTVGPPFGETGSRRILVGTNVPYAAFWEFGHYNIFTRRLERVEHWRESMMDRRPQVEEAFRRAFWRTVEQ